MKNGLYSIHTFMLDGVKGRDTGIMILRDGVLIGGGPYFWTTGHYTVADGTWKGHFRTDQHAVAQDHDARIAAFDAVEHEGVDRIKPVLHGEAAAVRPEAKQ